MNYNERELDPNVVPMVRFFNENGLKTSMSCQGHNKTNLSMFWIEFASEVTGDDIQTFMKNHLTQYGTFCSCGRFAKRLIGAYSITTQKWNTIESWNYFAATQEAADEDLKNWTSPENKWRGFEAEPYKSWREETLKRHYSTK